MTFHPRLLLVANPGRYRWIGLFAAMTWIVLTCQTAKASCGDYLHEHERANLGNRDHLNGSQNETGRSNSDHVPRCSGPACHSAPPVPYELPKASVTPVNYNELCQSFRGASEGSDPWSVVVRKSPHPTESPSLSPLERPPRVI